MTKKSKRPQPGNPVRAESHTVSRSQEAGEFDYETGEFVNKNSGAKRNDGNTRQVREAKREKFVRTNGSAAKSNFNVLYVAIPSLLIIIVGAILFMQNQSTADANVVAGNSIREVFIEPQVDGDKVSISAEEVRKNKLVAFDLKSGNKSVPLTAWVSPSGAIKTAIRICEPCNGKSFRIEGNHLVCNVCGTRWDLETLKGVSGGCQDYPPDPMPNTISGDTVVMNQAPLLAWTPRP